MPRSMLFKYMPSFLRRSSRTSMHNLRSWPLCIQPNPLRIQVATLVHVTTIQRSNPNQSFCVRVTHQHPNAHQTGKKTYNVDVLLAEDDDAADVCWRFQIAEEEDLLDRLSAYALAFGKYGSRGEDYDEYVHAFQGKIASLVATRTIDQEDRGFRDGDEDTVSSSFAEKGRGGHGVCKGRNTGNK